MLADRIHEQHPAPRVQLQTERLQVLPNVDADAPDEKNHPKLVSPAALYLVSDDAPNGRIIQAAGGRFASDMVFSNNGVALDLDATWEDVSDNASAILDLDDASWKTTFWKD